MQETIKELVALAKEIRKFVLEKNQTYKIETLSKSIECFIDYTGEGLITLYKSEKSFIEIDVEENKKLYGIFFSCVSIIDEDAIKKLIAKAKKEFEEAKEAENER